MKTEILYKIISTYLKEEYNIEEYKISSMKLDTVHTVNENGELEEVKTIDVIVKPTISVDKIEMKINLNTNEFK